MNKLFLKLRLMVAIVALLQVVACRRAILSEPSGDLAQVLVVCPPVEFKTLDGWPRTNTHIGSKGSQPLASNVDQIVEIFDLEKDRTEYDFMMFASSSAATKAYDAERADMADGAPPRREQDSGQNIRGFLRYVVRPRADAAGGYTPMNSYTARACFQLRNAVVKIEISSDNPTVPEMETALKQLALIVKTNPQPTK